MYFLKTTCLLILFTLVVSPLLADDVEDQLRKRKIRVSSNGAMLLAEIELTRELRKVTNLQRAVVTSEKRLKDFQRTVGLVASQIAALNRRSTLLNSQLANVTDVASNNRLVGAINTIESQLRLGYQKKEQLAKQEGDVHSVISRARDDFMAHVIKLRTLADDIDSQYKNVDRVTASLIRKYNQIEKTNIKLAPTNAFAANLKKLVRLEDKIITDKIKLRRDRNTYWAGVVVNDQPSIEMIVDSGASMIVLPFEDAVKLGVKPGRNDEKIRLIVADGRTISGYRMKLKSVRLGQFVVNDVECAVLGAEAVNAEPLLGMSFLNQFKFEINAGKSELLMTDLNADGKKRPVRSSSRPSPSSAVKVTRTVFPSDELIQPANFKIPYVSTNGKFTVEDEKLVTKSKQTTTLQLSDVVSDFELNINGKLTGKGGIYFLLGWDIETSSGYFLFYDELVNASRWYVQYMEDGQRVTIQQSLTNEKVSGSDFKLAVDQGHLIVESNGKMLIDAVRLERYHPGVVMMGTRNGQYPGKAVKISRIEMTETPAVLEDYERIPEPTSEDFSSQKPQNLLALKAVKAPDEMPILYYSKDKPVRALQAMTVTESTLTSPDKVRSIIQLDEHADNFALKFQGDFSARGYVFWLIGWDRKTSSGYIVEHSQLIRNSGTLITEIKNGKTGSATGVTSQRFAKSHNPTIIVKDKVLSIEINGRPIMKKFLLRNYQPGSIMIGTKSNRYGGKVIKISDIELREIE